MTGVYSVAEVIDDSNKRPEKTIFCYLAYGFDKSQIKVLIRLEKWFQIMEGSILKILKIFQNT